jgi:alkyl hydroperoxide reductase subunit AhpC
MDPEVKEAVTGLLLARHDFEGYGEEKVARDLVTDGLAVDKVPKRRQISNYKYQLTRRWQEIIALIVLTVTFNQFSAVVNAHKWTEGMADHKPFAFCSNVNEWEY